MTEALKRVQSGDPLVIPAATYNTFIDAAQDYRQRTRHLGRHRPGPQRQQRRPRPLRRAGRRPRRRHADGRPRRLQGSRRPRRRHAVGEPAHRPVSNEPPPPRSSAASLSAGCASTSATTASRVSSIVRAASGGGGRKRAVLVRMAGGERITAVKRHGCHDLRCVSSPFDSDTCNVTTFVSRPRAVAWRADPRPPCSRAGVWPARPHRRQRRSRSAARRAP